MALTLRRVALVAALPPVLAVGSLDVASAAARTPPASSSAPSGSASTSVAPPSSTAPPASSSAAPEPPTAPAPDAHADEHAAARAAAVDLFRRGMSLLKAGDLERALDLLLQSRKLFPSKGNTLNAAICLDKLGRYDEALGLYEEAIATFAAALDEEDRAALPGVMERLRGKVGSLDVAGDVTGAIVLVDGRDRARLPMSTPIRVTPGAHTVRVVKDGYQAFEQRVEIELGKTLKVDARLHALQASGGLRVEAAELDGATISVDGVELGESPWEGTLAPGQHVVSSRKGDVGSAPTRVLVVAGQTALLRLRSGPLGPLSVRVHPDEAQLRIGDGLLLGAGTWNGVLPEGEYTFEVRAEGYRSQTKRVRVVKGALNAPIEVTLAIDPTHPRWPKKAGKSGTVWLDALGGVALGSSLGGGAESACPDACSKTGLVFGGVAGLRGGYEFPIGLSIEAGGGYMALQRDITRGATRTFVPTDPTQTDVQVIYAVEDAISMHGPFAAVGIGYRHVLSGPVDFGAGLDVGALFAATHDTISATATGNGRTVDAYADPPGGVLRSAALFVLPEARLKFRIGHFDLGFAFAAALFLTDGPRYPTKELLPVGECPQASTAPTPVECVGGRDVVAGERAYGRFVAWMPTLTFGGRL